jgi:hypothetical protein|tara:strand:- start:276 stop:728 length:453 start_codon:yes stop_codon:yes gene_type:complete
MSLVLGTTYNNIFYENVLQKLKSIIVTDRACKVYVSPMYKDSGSYAIRLWGSSSETDLMTANEWRALYNVEISLYTIGDDGERFYEQLYSDSERLYQLLFNNKENGASSFPWHDGTVSSVTYDEYTEEEVDIEGLHVARFLFSCRLSRAS